MTDVQQRQLKALLSDGRQGRHWNKAALGRRESASSARRLANVHRLTCADEVVLHRGCREPISSSS